MAEATEIEREATTRGMPTRGPTAPSRTLNAMTVDVEDYFQVEAFAKVVSRDRWETMPRRVEENTDRLLALFADHGVKATFFVLGWIATRHRPLIQRIVAGGHELASHGFSHLRADRQSREEFRSDVRDTRRLLEDVGGVPVIGYRAATFSIGRGNWWAYDVLSEEGYDYSSSVFPIVHDLYGVPDAPREPFRPTGAPILEIPLTTVRLFGRNLPCSGGGYFRLLPYGISRRGFARVIERERRPCIFYCHPWEIDPAQPRQTAAPLKSRLRHYLNLGKMERRIARLLRDFAWGRMDEAFLGTSGKADGARRIG
ncbi:MAG TPA: XrtA system polysaccharide deacetylase [Stellaceae bacterium]|nr:XrtA system polysaccharide deacetylase [Stellaceae bacterium]